MRIAADLRAANDPLSALRILDAASLLWPGEAAERAIFTVAVAANCDAGRHDVAEVLVREQAVRSVDAKLASAAVRLYSELYDETEDERHAAERDRWRAVAEQDLVAKGSGLSF